MSYDRGAFTDLQFTRCERGFTLMVGGRNFEGVSAVYAFDRIEDVGAWLVEQYRDAPSADQASPPTA